MTRIIGGSILSAFIVGLAVSSASAQLETFVVKGAVTSIMRADGASAWTSQIAVGDSFEYSFIIDLRTPRDALISGNNVNYQIGSAFGKAGPIAFQSTDHSGQIVNAPPYLSLFKSSGLDGLTADSYVTMDGVNLNDVTEVMMSLYGFDPVLSDIEIPTHLPPLSDFLGGWLNLRETPFTGPGEQYSDFEADVSISSFSIVAPLTPIPEPTTYGLFACVGLLGVVGWRKYYRTS